MPEYAPDNAFCGACRRAIRALARHERALIDEPVEGGRSRGDEQWLKSKARDATAYRETMALFGLTTTAAVRQLPAQRLRLFQAVWTRCMIRLIPPKERVSLRENMERRHNCDFSVLFEEPPEVLLLYGEGEEFFF